MVNTGKVKNRRQLRFETLADAVRDAEVLAAAERDGNLKAVGNWTLGQAIGHIAYWANVPFEGYPTLPQMPWIMRRLLPLLKNRFLNKGLPAGARIPGTPQGTLGVDKMPTDEAVDRMRAAFERLDSQMPTHPNPVFGQMSHEDWVKLNLRHSELHLSFFQPT